MFTAVQLGYKNMSFVQTDVEEASYCTSKLTFYFSTGVNATC